MKVCNKCGKLKSDDEYMQEFCNKCKNRKRFDDICEIRKNIKGEPQCMNFEEEKKEKRNKLMFFQNSKNIKKVNKFEKFSQKGAKNEF